MALVDQVRLSRGGRKLVEVGQVEVAQCAGSRHRRGEFPADNTQTFQLQG